MNIVPSPAQARTLAASLREGGRHLGFVPTMGALHDGHLSLVRASVIENEYTAVSIFVNPLQFGPREDLDRYPRDLDGDLSKLEGLGVQLVFTPTPEVMYPEGYATHVTVEGLTEGLCGRHRPGHFRGVTTIVTKLFNIVRPDRAYFGAKDYQQARVIQRMALDLETGIEVKVLPTVREPDGLAMSSRNLRLTPDGRVRARALSRGLREAVAVFARGERDPGVIAAAARRTIEETPEVEIEYVEVLDADRIAPIASIDDRALLAVAAHVEGIRLIDNVVLGDPRLSAL